MGFSIRALASWPNPSGVTVMDNDIIRNKINKQMCGLAHVAFIIVIIQILSDYQTALCYSYSRMKNV